MNSNQTLPVGRLYGIGLGPGDPELVTVKASRLLARLRYVFAPKADESSASIARGIASSHAGPDVDFRELVYPMTRDPEQLQLRWNEAAQVVVDVLAKGDDAGFITLGDPLLYSTFSYLMRAVRQLLPAVEIEIVPAVMSFAASAALTGFVLGERESKLTVAPAPDDQEALNALISRGGRLVLMKVGNRLPRLVEWLRQAQRLRHTRLVVRAGLPGQQIFHDLEQIDDLERAGYLSTLLVNLDPEGAA